MAGNEGAGRASRIVMIMGVAGSGKTTVGERLAARLGWPFFDADAFHPPQNIRKMARGLPLSDEDREPWLEAIHDAMVAHVARGESAVFTCSALKRCYRERLSHGLEPYLVWVYLKGEYELIQARMQARQEHFMKPALLKSQFDALEEPEGVLTLSVAAPVDALVDTIAAQLAASGS